MRAEMMTESQLESAAREYCRLAEIDPDVSIGHSAQPNANGMITLQLCYSPQWKIIAQTMAQADLVNHCLEVGKSNVNMEVPNA